jgi:acetate---CoA ligase (ADP-forming)
VLARLVQYTSWRQKPRGILPEFDDIDLQTARSVCQDARTKHGPGWLSASATRTVLEAIKLPIPPSGVAVSEESALQIADRVGYPVVLKLASRTIVHKTDFGGVFLNLKNADEVRRAFGEMREALARSGQLEAMEGALVQPMLAGGVEVMVGMTLDPLFGPLIAFGLGGIYVEMLKDVCFRISPLTDRDAEEMIASIRGYRLLQGYRGQPPADTDALKDVLLRVARLIEEVPTITELDLNPIFAHERGKGCTIADARIRV